MSPNQNCEHQNFFPTKKKRYSSTPTLSKPTVKEINKIEKDFEGADVKFCSGCLKDDTTTVDAIEWIQCDRWDSMVTSLLHTTTTNYYTSELYMSFL